MSGHRDIDRSDLTRHLRLLARVRHRQLMAARQGDVIRSAELADTAASLRTQIGQVPCGPGEALQMSA
jgi:hypothetical protein